MCFLSTPRHAHLWSKLKGFLMVRLAWCVGLGGLCGLMALTLPVASAAVAQNTAVSRGEYVARAADCMSCHTPPGGKLFSGGDELKTVFGSIYGPNITPDKRTGIGTWTKHDFERALREGVRKDGGLLYPAMPYVDYTKMSNQDLDDLWVYMNTIPAVDHVVPPAEKTFKFPFNIRAGNAAWQAIFFKPVRWTATPSKNATWNRGNYLVTVLGHCGECHTPKNVAKAQETKYYLTGGQLEGWYAPDISSDPLSAIRGYNVDQVAHFLKTGTMAGNVTAFGPMAETVHDSTRFLSDADLHSIATYLKDQPPPDYKPADKATITPQQLALGKKLYTDNCSSCHQPDGKGIPHNVPALDGNTVVTAAQPNDVIMAMIQGFGPNDTWGAMGSFAKLDNYQLADIANYVRTAWSNHAEPNAYAWAVGNWRGFADIPAKERQPDLICPLLSPEIMEPALAENSDQLRNAASNRADLAHVVSTYLHARPKSTPAETVEALSTAYCRAIVSEKVPMAISGAKMASFSQEVALALANSRSTGS